AGVLHRDVKPGNVLLTRDDHAKLGDFGLARDLDDAVAGTRTIGAVGTPAFMAPEVARDGMDAFTARSDIYGLGAVLYQMLTGRPPHLGSDPLKVLDDVRTRRPPKPRSIRPDVPLDLEVLCVRCMDPDPAQRFASAHEVADELQRHLDGIPILSRPSGPVRHLVAWMRRHRALAASLFALMAALVGGLALVSWQWLRAEQLARSLSSSLAVARLTTAQSQWDAGNNLRALADVARAMHDHDPRHDARRLLEHWLHQGAFVPPPGLVWKHPAPVVRAVYSPDARRILVQLENRDLFVRAADSTQVVLHLHGVDMGHSAVPGFDDATLLARQKDGTLRLWSLPKDTNAPVVALEVPRIRVAAVSAPHAHWAALDEAGDLWTGTADARAMPRRETSMHPPAPWRTLAISADGRWIAGARPGGGWDLLDMKATRSPRPPDAGPDASASFHGKTQGPVSALAFNPKDASLLVVGTGFAELWTPGNRWPAVRVTDPIHWSGGRFDGSGRRVFLSDERGVFYLLDVAARRARLCEKDSDNARMTLPWSSSHLPDLQRVAFVSPSLSTESGDSLRMYHAPGQLQSTLVKHPSAITSIAIHPGRTRVLVGCEDGTVRAWTWNRATWAPAFPVTNGPGIHLSPVPRGGALLVVRPDGPGLWDPSKAFHSIRRLPMPALQEPLPIPGEGFGPNAVLGLDPTRRQVRLHALDASSSPTPDATAPLVLADLPEPAHALAASPNGRRIAWAGNAHVGWVRRPQGKTPWSRSLALPKARQVVV
ncbi:MAG: protein kinase domain-containing protein, partial [Verrucomicrobiota bacterium]